MGNPLIVKWIKKICKRYRLSSFYIPRKDVYMLHFKGRSLQGFTEHVFFQMDPSYRERQLIGILKRGLMLNINENNRDNLYTQRRLGKIIHP
jgi:hypothetical protein